MRTVAIWLDHTDAYANLTTLEMESHVQVNMYFISLSLNLIKNHFKACVSHSVSDTADWE